MLHLVREVTSNKLWRSYICNWGQAIYSILTRRRFYIRGGQEGPGPVIFGSMETRMLFSTTIFASVVVDGVLRLEGCRVSLIALIFAYLACLIFNCLGPPWLTTPCTWLAFVIWQKVCPNFIIIVPQPTNQHGGDTPTDDFLRKVRAGQNGTPVRKVKTQDHQPTFHVSKLKKSGFNGFHIVKRTRKGHVPGIWSFQPQSMSN